MSKKTILYSFIVVCIVYFFSSLLQLDDLEIISKPLFLPILFLYYIKKSKNKFQKRVIVSFVLYYLAEILVLKDNKQFYLISIVLFLIPYMILLYYVIKDLLSLLKVHSINKINFTIFFILAFLIYLYVSIILIIETQSLFEQILLRIYGFVLLVLCVFSIAIYALKHSFSNLNLVIAIILFILSDMFYIFIVKIEYNWVFKSINLISQLLSYYFYVNYSLIKAKGK
jgi:hypothetical protein